MFGLEGQKKKKEEFVFELEVDFKKGDKRQEHIAHVEQRIQSIKTILRKGEEKEEFDSLGLLLYGYASALKVVSRFVGKK